MSFKGDLLIFDCHLIALLTVQILPAFDLAIGLISLGYLIAIFLYHLLLVFLLTKAHFSVHLELSHLVYQKPNYCY